jgi:hypothetical protein
MSDSTYDYCKYVILNHSLILILCLFLVVYLVINYNLINQGNIYSGNLPKTIIVTGIIFLLIYTFVVWDDDEVSNDFVVNVPKYRIVNKLNPVSDLSQKELKIDNKYNNKYEKESSTSKQENIFISNKHKAKFGIKF